MTSGNPNEPITYPIFTVRWLSVHAWLCLQFSFWARSPPCNLFNARRILWLIDPLTLTSNLLS